MKRPARSKSSTAPEEATPEFLEEELIDLAPPPEIGGDYSSPVDSAFQGSWQLTRLPTVWLLGYALPLPPDLELQETQIRQALSEFSSRQLLRRIPGQQTDRVICLARAASPPSSTEGGANTPQFLMGAEVDKETPAPVGMAKWPVAAGLYIVLERHAAANPEAATTAIPTAQDVATLSARQHSAFDEWLTDLPQIDSREGVRFERHDLDSKSGAKVFFPVTLADES